MQNSALDPRDQRKTSSMEDSAAITIEFLRARLLSERSISRSARLRAHELDKKVMELEEQLRVVTLQRKMAEKATANVLAILENHGISDVSEEFDLGSDVEIPCESGVSNYSAKGGNSSMSSKGKQHGSDELSGSDVDSSPISGRSLSWKGRHYAPRSVEKYKILNFRRQSGISSVSSSPKHHLGKSCRKIRHKQTRSEAEESGDKSMKDNLLENEDMSYSEGNPNCAEDGYEREKDMEMAFEFQAQLIDRYKAMERAQRDWEEKFRENNNTTPNSCHLGNHSDMTEEKDESKAQFPSSSKVDSPNAKEDKEEPTGDCLSEEIFKSGAGDDIPGPRSFDDTGGGCDNQKSTTSSTSDLLGPKNSHSLLKGNNNESSVNYHYQSSDKQHKDSHGHANLASKPKDSFPADDYGSGLHQNEASRNKNDLYALASHEEQSSKLSSVLESLKQARTSLQQELNRLPLVEPRGYPSKAIYPSPPVCKTDDRFGIPVGCSALFRLPTDFSDEATARFNVHGSNSGFRSNFYLDRGTSRSSGGQLISNPYSGPIFSFSPDVQSLTTENEPRFDYKRSPFDSFSSEGLPSSAKFIYPSFPIHPSYQNATMQMPFGDGLSSPYPSSRVGVPLAHDFAVQGDHLRSNMYI